VNKQVFAALWLGLCLSLVLSSTNCVTCPDGQQSCGNSNASGSAGADGDDDAMCPLLSAMRDCMDTFCKTATNPFCTCYKRGFDLTTNGCKCIDFNAQKFCDNAENNGVDASAYDCAAASSGVSSYCVGVQ
jgi:hypothetical protein